MRCTVGAFVALCCTLLFVVLGHQFDFTFNAFRYRFYIVDETRVVYPGILGDVRLLCW